MTKSTQDNANRKQQDRAPSRSQKDRDVTSAAGPADPLGILYLQQTVGNRVVTRLLQQRANLEADVTRAVRSESTGPSNGGFTTAPISQDIDEEDEAPQEGPGEAHRASQDIEDEEEAPQEGARAGVSPETDAAGSRDAYRPQDGRLDRSENESVEAAAGPEGGQVSPELAGRIEGKRGGGSQLDSNVRMEMEGAFNTSFEDVRVHADSESHEISRDLNAHAFATGSDIFFSSGAYQPGTEPGKHLLAHELTHVIQQRQSSARGPLTVGASGDEHEREADQVASEVSTMLQQAGAAPSWSPSSPSGIPSYLHPSLVDGRSDVAQYQMAISQFRAQNDGTTLNLYRARLAEMNGQMRISQDGPLQRIRRMGRDSGATVTPPDVATIRDNKTVKAAIEQAWQDSNPNAKAVRRGRPGSTKQEQGGWIIWNSSDDTYRVTRVGAGTRDSLPTIGGTRPSPSSPEMLVAWFHTHPNTTAEGYSNEPSPADRTWQASYAKVPGIVRAHDGYHTIPYP